MPQLQITAETMTRIKIITGISHVRDGDFMVNELIMMLMITFVTSNQVTSLRRTMINTERT